MPNQPTWGTPQGVETIRQMRERGLDIDSATERGYVAGDTPAVRRVRKALADHKPRLTLEDFVHDQQEAQRQEQRQGQERMARMIFEEMGKLRTAMQPPPQPDPLRALRAKIENVNRAMPEITALLEATKTED